MAVNYFDFYNSVSSVYSSKIEGEEIEYDSFYKYKFLKVEFEPDYTRRSEDLFKAYQFILSNKLSKINLQKAHSILAQSFLPEKQRGRLRKNEMYVIGRSDRIEYVACSKYKLEQEFDHLFIEMNELLDAHLSISEIFYYAALSHLVFVKIHPFQDGNGRIGRLLEKWFLISKLGNDAVSIDLEKNYYLNRNQYYANIKLLGLEYGELDYSKSLEFLRMTISSLKPT